MSESSKPAEPKWDLRGKFVLQVASAVTVLLVGSLAFYLTGGWEHFFEFLGKPVTVPLVVFVFLLLGWLLLAVAVAAGAVFLVYKKLAAKPPRKPAELTIDGIKWRMDRGTLSAFCPKCDMELARNVITSAYAAAGALGYSYHCEECKTVKEFEGQDVVNIEAPVRRKLEQLIRKGKP